MTADVVIPTWRASDLLRRCLFAPGDWVGLADALAAGPLAGAPGTRRAPDPARLERFPAPAAAARLRAVYEELAPG